MYHIVKTKSKKQPFQLVLLRRGKVLNSSETFSSKQSCFRNVCAIAKELELNPEGIFVQDDTKPDLNRFLVFASGEISPYEYGNPEPKYIPGKNPKTKKKKST